MGIHGLSTKEKMDIEKEARVQHELEHVRELDIFKRWKNIIDIDKQIVYQTEPQPIDAIELQYEPEEKDSVEHKGMYGGFLNLMLQGPQVDDEFMCYVSEAKKQYKPPRKNARGVASDENDEGWTSQKMSVHFT